MSNPVLKSENRLRNIVGGLVLVIVVMIALNLALTLVFGQAPVALGRAELVDLNAMSVIAARIASVEAQLETESATEPPLAVVLGLSTAREGFDPILFRQATDDRYKLLNLGASGGSFRELAAYSQPLIDSRLRPAILILAVHASWLAGRTLRAPSQAPLPPAPREVTWVTSLEYGRHLQSWAVQRVWILANRVAIHAELRRAMYWLRSRIAGLVDQKLREVVPGGDPWEVKSSYGSEQASPEFLAMQLKEWAAFGWFDASRFGDQSDEAKTLRELLKSLKELSPKVVLVLMPESVAFRSRVPAKAVTAVTMIAQGVDKSTAILDLRASMTDQAFRDQAHLNVSGHQQFSALIGRQLRAQD
jgi:hypothetical protein